MHEIKDISPEGAELSSDELKLVVGGGQGDQPRSWALTQDEVQQVCKADWTGNDAPILAAY